MEPFNMVYKLITSIDIKILKYSFHNSYAYKIIWQEPNKLGFTDIWSNFELIGYIQSL